MCDCGSDGAANEEESSGSGSGDQGTQEEDSGGFADLSELPVEESERRPTCSRCW